MLHRVVLWQTGFLLRQKEAILVQILLGWIVLGNYLRNVLSFHGLDVSQMYHPMKLISLSYNLTYDKADITLIFVMLYPVLVTLPAGFAYVREQQTKEEVFLLARIGKETYLLGKLLAAFVTTFVTFTAPFLAELGMNMLSFPPEACRDLSNLSIYSEEYLQMQSNYLFPSVYIRCPLLYTILGIALFGAISGLLGMLTVSLSYVVQIKYRILLLFPVFALLNGTAYLDAVIRKEGAVGSWYEYMLLFSDVPKQTAYLAAAVCILVAGIGLFYGIGRTKERW